MSRRNLTLLGFCLLSVLALHLSIRHQHRHLEFSRYDSSGGFQTPMLRIRLIESQSSQTPERQTSRPVALILHGLSASKSAMFSLATQLALRGVDCYTMDLPGHGESSRRFSVSAARGAVHEGIKSLRAEAFKNSRSGQVGAAPLILIGHSFGAGSALNAARSDLEVLAVVALSPTAEPVEGESPKNWLVLLGEFDFPFVRRGAGFVFAQGTGAGLPLLDQPGSWQNSDGSHRLVVLPWTDHTRSLFGHRSLIEIADWLNRLGLVVRQTGPSSVLFFLQVLLCVGWLLLFFPLFNLLVDTLSVLEQRRTGSALSVPVRQQKVPTLPTSVGYQQERERISPAQKKPLVLPGVSQISLLGIYGVAAGLSAILLLWINPWDRLDLLGGSYLCGFFCVTGLAALGWRRPGGRLLRVSWTQLLTVLFALAYLVFWVGPILSCYFIHVTLSWERAWRIPFVCVSFLPFYLFDEWASRCFLQPGTRAHLVLFHLSSRLILALVLLLGFFVLQNSQFLIVLLWPALFSLTVVCWGFAGWIYHRTHSLVASAFFSALASAWFFCTFFPQL